MSEKKAYCEKCGKEASFATRGRQTVEERDGRAYVYRRNVALCKKCGSELTYEPFEKAARKAMDEAVKNSPGLVTCEQIRELPRRYAIGKRPLSRLLGWGELTYTRLMDGRVPTQEHSDELRRLIDDPAAFARLLEHGRASGAITGLAYERSRKAVESLLAESEGGSTAIFAVADRLCALAEGDLTPRALQMLVYYAHGFSFTTGDDELFDRQPRAAAYGPEYQQVKDGYAFADIQAAFERAQATAGDDVTETQQRASALADAAWSKYGDLSGSALARRARSEAPWRKARKRADAPDGVECDELITAKSMKKFFSKAAKK